MIKKLSVLAVGLVVATSGSVLAQNFAPTSGGNEGPFGGQEQRSSGPSGPGSMPSQGGSMGMNMMGMNMMMAPFCHVADDADGGKAAAFKKDFFALMRSNRAKMRSIDDVFMAAVRKAEDGFFEAMIATAETFNEESDEEEFEEGFENADNAQDDYNDAVESASATAKKARRAAEKEQKAAMKALQKKYGCSSAKRRPQMNEGQRFEQGGQGQPIGEPRREDGQSRPQGSGPDGGFNGGPRQGTGSDQGGPSTSSGVER